MDKVIIRKSKARGYVDDAHGSLHARPREEEDDEYRDRGKYTPPFQLICLTPLLVCSKKNITFYKLVQ